MATIGAGDEIPGDAAMKQEVLRKVFRVAAVVFSSVWGGMTLLLLSNSSPSSSSTLLRLGLLFMLSLVAIVAVVHEKVGLIYVSVVAAFVPLGYYLLGSPLFWPIGVSILGVLVCAIALHILGRDAEHEAPLASGK